MIIKVIEIVLRVKRRTKRFVPGRGYSPQEIANYLLSELRSELTYGEVKVLEQVKKGV